MNNFFELPLSPIDLTKIYEEKISLIPIDYLGSKENLGVKQSLIYIANTQFEVEFDFIDEELLSEFLKLDFYVNSPQLSLCIKVALDKLIGLNINEENYEHYDLFSLFGDEFFVNFINENKDSLNDIVLFLKSMPLYIFSNSIEFIEDEKLKSNLLQIEVNTVNEERKMNFGINIIYNLPIFVNTFLNIISNDDFSMFKNNTIYTNIMNTEPRYGGADFLGKLNELSFINFFMSFLFNQEENNKNNLS